MRLGAYATPRSATGWPVITTISLAEEKQLYSVDELAHDLEEASWSTLTDRAETAAAGPKRARGGMLSLRPERASVVGLRSARISTAPECGRRGDSCRPHHHSGDLATVTRGHPRDRAIKELSSTAARQDRGALRPSNAAAMIRTARPDRRPLGRRRDRSDGGPEAVVANRCRAEHALARRALTHVGHDGPMCCITHSAADRSC